VIQFEIPWLIAAKQADRSRIVTGKGRQFVHHYQPKKVVDNARSLAALCSPYRPSKPLEGPIRLDLYVVFPWLKKHRPKHRQNGPIPKDTKPDADNTCKQILDVLQGCGFFSNDSQISDLRVRKRFGDSPSVGVTISEDACNL